MKKTCKTIASLVMMLVLLLGIGAPAYAEGNVTYLGGAEKFVFLPGIELGYTETDLFDGFKGVMPGDELEQKIEVTNNRRSGSVNIYLRAVAHDEDDNPLSDEVAAAGETVESMTRFLKQLTMEVYKQDGTRIFYESPDQLDGLQNNVLLGNFSYGSETELTVILKVPDTMGNEFANRVGEVDWVFSVVELDPQGNPKTGDTSNLTLWIVVMVVCLVAVAVVAFLILKKKKQN